jgi:hypothetical protein
VCIQSPVFVRSSESLGPTKSFVLARWACSLGLFIWLPYLYKVSVGMHCFAGALVDFASLLLFSPPKFIFVRRLPFAVTRHIFQLVRE